MLDAATPQVRAAILLGINCGFGNTDVADLPVSKLDLDRGWHNFGRPKTGVERRCPLWAETIEALREVIAQRRKPKDEVDADLVFITRHGQRYVRLKENGTWNDAISRETGKLLRELCLKRPGLNFYTLRRTFRTIGDEARDQPAVMHIMGHADSDSDMRATYRQFIDDDRLQAVVDHVHDWLFSRADEEPNDYC
jgi:integrase